MTAAPEFPAPVPAGPGAACTGAAGAGAAGLAREWLLPFPLDARLSLAVHRRGGGDPAYAVDPAGAVWRTCLTPDGPAMLRVRSRAARIPEAGDPARTAEAGDPARTAEAGPSGGASGGTLVTAQAWGPGAAWLLDRLP